MTAAALRSSTLERDAAVVNADGRAPKPGEIAVGVIIGRTSEFFDFFVNFHICVGFDKPWFKFFVAFVNTQHAV